MNIIFKMGTSKQVADGLFYVQMETKNAVVEADARALEPAAREELLRQAEDNAHKAWTDQQDGLCPCDDNTRCKRCEEARLLAAALWRACHNHDVPQ